MNKHTAIAILIALGAGLLAIIWRDEPKPEKTEEKIERQTQSTETTGKSTTVRKKSGLKYFNTIELGSIDGIQCKSYERNDYYTRVETAIKLTKQQITIFQQKLKVETDIIYFHLPEKKDANKEYAVKINENITIYK